MSIFTILILSTIAAVAEETTNKDGVFVRGGVQMSHGSVADKHKSTYSQDDPYYGGYDSSYSSTVVIGTVGTAFDTSLGYESYSESGEDNGMRYYVNLKRANETIGYADATSTQVGFGFEGFQGIKRIHLNYGVLLFVGTSDLTSTDEEAIDLGKPNYVGVEPYVGIDGIFTGNFGYYAKLGYQMRSFDKVSNTEKSYYQSTDPYGNPYTVTTTETTNDELTTNEMTFGVGLLYKF